MWFFNGFLRYRLHLAVVESMASFWFVALVSICSRKIHQGKKSSCTSKFWSFWKWCKITANPSVDSKKIGNVSKGMKLDHLLMIFWLKNQEKLKIISHFWKDLPTFYLILWGESERGNTFPSQFTSHRKFWEWGLNKMNVKGEVSVPDPIYDDILWYQSPLFLQ